MPYPERSLKHLYLACVAWPGTMGVCSSPWNAVSATVLTVVLLIFVAGFCDGLVVTRASLFGELRQSLQRRQQRPRSNSMCSQGRGGCSSLRDQELGVGFDFGTRQACDGV